MFEREINEIKNAKERVGAEKPFHEWLKAQGLGSSGFELSVPTKDVWKGKYITWNVVSWGHYQVQSGWMVYISYKCSAVNHVRQHTWRWGNGAVILDSYKLNEFINT
jgi:hypothetical protein